MRESLCSRCGSSRWEYVRDTQSQCAECGLGRTHGKLTAYRATSASGPSAEQLAQADEAAASRAETTARVFAEAGFDPYGLDARWIAFRFFGGHGSSDGHTHTLTLGHCDVPGDRNGQDIRVETQRVDVRGANAARAIQGTLYTMTQLQLQHFWHETGVMPDDVRHAAFLAEGPDVDRTAPWATVELTVDQEPVMFRALAYQHFWVAQAPHDGVVIGIQARRWNIDDTGLVTVRDTTAYAEGTRTMHRRWHRPTA